MNEVTILAGDTEIRGYLEIPSDAKGVVIFSHGSGSGRLSPRNQWVAEIIREGRLGTLLMDLLSTEEEVFDSYTGTLRFDIPFLSQRLSDVTDWLMEQKEAESKKIGYFGSSTGAASALVAASKRPGILAVVSRGGRPDLAMDVLHQVHCPTLFLVGGEDHEVIKLNQLAFDQLTCKKELSIVPGATHRFEEPGTLEQVANQSRDWFTQYLSNI